MELVQHVSWFIVLCACILLFQGLQMKRDKELQDQIDKLKSEVRDLKGEHPGFNMDV